MSALAGIRDGVVSAGGSTNLLVGIVLAAALAAVVAAILSALTSASPRGKVRALLEDRAVVSGGTSRWVVRLGIPLLALAAVLAGDFYLSRTPTCLQCHRDGAQGTALATTAHASLECRACHLAGGIGGTSRRLVTYARWVAVYGVTKQPPAPAPGSVDDRECLRCHRVGGGVVITARAIKVRHSDFLETGARCRECHNSTAHPEVGLEPSEPSMDGCTVCHDGLRASNECDTCHVRDLALDTTVPRGYSRLKQTSERDVCYRCHDPAPCTGCHGVVMPHPAGWSPADRERAGYGHAREGFADREVCWRCHYDEGKPFEPGEASCSCHGVLGQQHGGAAWVTEHGPEATGRNSGVNNKCFDCHSPGLCDYCHSADYAARYSPRDDAPLDPGYAQPSGGPAQDW